MILAKLKDRSQLTLPQSIVKALHLRADELFSLDIEENYIKLTPVDIEPRYAPEELKAIDHIVEKEKGHAKAFKPGKEFSDYVRKITQ